MTDLSLFLPVFGIYKVMILYITDKMLLKMSNTVDKP